MPCDDPHAALFKPVDPFFFRIWRDFLTRGKVGQSLLAVVASSDEDWQPYKVSHTQSALLPSCTLYRLDELARSLQILQPAPASTAVQRRTQTQLPFLRASTGATVKVFEGLDCGYPRFPIAATSCV